MPPSKFFRIIGYQEDATFQQCVEAAAYLASEHSDTYKCTVERNFPYQFEQARRQLVPADTPENLSPLSTARVLVLASQTTPSKEDGGNSSAQPPRTDSGVRTADEFLQMIQSETDFRLFDVAPEAPNSYQSLAHSLYKGFLKATGSAFTWMLLKRNDSVLGRLTFMLYTKTAPFTSQNFLHLCRGDLPDAIDEQTQQKIKLSYKGTKIFRVVRNGWIQGGDITPPFKGNGGRSIYGKAFPDETFEVKHDDEGILGMANDGEHTAASSFYVTVGKSAWMNSRYVAFGRVIDGMDVVRALHNLPTKHSQAPQDDITIVECGEIVLDG